MADRDRHIRNEDDTIEPERPETIQEREGVAPSRRKDPPKAEGDRDEAEDGEGGGRGSRES